MPEEATQPTLRDDDAPPQLPARRDDDRPGFLTAQAPLIDSLPQRWVEFLVGTVAQVEDGAPPITMSEVGMFVELCANYGLDPFAREAWLAKSSRGKLLVMVGRDGLRKIGQRNGLHIDGDVVREGDEFAMVRTPDGNRTVAHSYGSPQNRGAVVGAWAECREGGPLGRPMGYFYAPLDEYLPKNVSHYSPWSKQVGVMILAAAERQAIRQATPLSGLVAEGEAESAFARQTGPALTDGAPARGDGEPENERLGVLVEDVLMRAEAVGHRGLADRAAARMATVGQPDEVIEEWVARARAVLAPMEDATEEPTDAEVVEPGGEGDRRSAAQIMQDEVDSIDAAEAAADSEEAGEVDPGPEPVAGAEEPQEDAQAPVSPELLQARAQQAMDDALAAQEADHPDAERLMEYADRLASEAQAADDDDQEQMAL